MNVLTERETGTNSLSKLTKFPSRGGIGPENMLLSRDLNMQQSIRAALTILMKAH